MRRIALLLVMIMSWWIAGCVGSTARTAGQQAAGGFFDQVDGWWARKRAEVLAEARKDAGEQATTAADAAKASAVIESRSAAAEFAAGAKDTAIAFADRMRQEAVKTAVELVAPKVDAAAERAAAQLHELVDAKIGATGTVVKDLVLAQLEPRVQAQVDELRAGLEAGGWSREATATPGQVLAESGRRAAAGEWDEAKAGLVTFLGMLLALGVRGGVRIAAEKMKPTAPTP